MADHSSRTRVDWGTYCYHRIQPSFNDAMVRCSYGQAKVTAGVCTDGPLNADYQVERPNAEPANTGHYCNVIDSDGKWGIRIPGTDPCATLLQTMPSATIVRAGLYSTTGKNDVLVRCSDGGVLEGGVGLVPLSTARAKVGHGTNKCIVTVSPRELAVFDAPFPAYSWLPTPWNGSTLRGYTVGHRFDHARTCVDGEACPCTTSPCALDLNAFGSGQFWPSTAINSRGRRNHRRTPRRARLRLQSHGGHAPPRAGLGQGHRWRLA